MLTLHSDGRTTTIQPIPYIDNLLDKGMGEHELLLPTTERNLEENTTTWLSDIHVGDIIEISDPLNPVIVTKKFKDGSIEVFGDKFRMSFIVLTKWSAPPSFKSSLSTDVITT